MVYIVLKYDFIIKLNHFILYLSYYYIFLLYSIVMFHIINYVTTIWNYYPNYLLLWLLIYIILMVSIYHYNDFH